MHGKADDFFKLEIRKHGDSTKLEELECLTSSIKKTKNLSLIDVYFGEDLVDLLFLKI